MTVPASGPARLGWFVKQRRVEKRLSQAAAAKTAGISRLVWSNVENAVGTSYDTTYGRVETTLGWALGSCEAVLQGGDPVPADGTALTPLEKVDRTIEALEDPSIDWGDEDVRALMLRKARAIRDRLRDSMNSDSRALG